MSNPDCNFKCTGCFFRLILPHSIYSYCCNKNRLQKDSDGKYRPEATMYINNCNLYKNSDYQRPIYDFDYITGQIVG